MENKLATQEHWTSTLADILIANQIQCFVTVTDSAIAKLIMQLRLKSPHRIIQSCKEDEGIGIVSGAYLAGQRGVMMMQSSGFGLCGNALSFNIAGSIPLILVISKRGDVNDNSVQIPIGNSVEPILEQFEIPFCKRTDEKALLKEGDELIKHAYHHRVPVAFVMPGKM